ERLDGDTVGELAGKDAHADEVRTVDALEAPRDDDVHAEEARALGRPVARAAGAVLLAGDDDLRRALGDVAHRRVVDAHPLAARLVNGHAALDARHHDVLDAPVGGGAPTLARVGARARGGAVEAPGRHAGLRGFFPRRRRRLDRARRADVIGGDRVAEQRERTRAEDFLRRCSRAGELEAL